MIDLRNQLFPGTVAGMRHAQKSPLESGLRASRSDPALIAGDAYWR
ncbi:hypothetical protein [Burkholderia sp. PU8-34]